MRAIIAGCDAVADVVPDEPAEGGEQDEEDGDTGPAEADIRARNIFIAVFADVFGEFDPADVVILELAALLVGGHEAADPVVFIEADDAGIAAHDALVENPAGEGIEMFLFQSEEVATADLGYVSDCLDRDTAGFPLFPQIFAELTHVPFLRRYSLGLANSAKKLSGVSTANHKTMTK